MTTKTISYDDSLRALALFTMAREHYAKSREFEAGMARVLGLDENYPGHLSDAITNNDSDFHQALGKEEIEVAPKPEATGGE